MVKKLQLTPKEKDPRGITVTFANNILHHDRKNLKGIEAVLAVKSLSGAWRDDFQNLLTKRFNGQ